LPGGAALATALFFAFLSAAQAEIKFYTNVVMIQYYDNIPGTAVSSLTGNAKFPNSPDRVVFAAIPEIPVDGGNNYGVRITGVLFPTYTEAFYLVMNSDDQGELHLSSDTNAANKVLIAREPEWNATRAWSSTARRPDSAKVNPAQPAPNVSVPVVMTLGEPRYFELLMKEGSGGDNLAMTINPEISATPAPPDGTPPDFSAFGLGVYADDVPRVLSGPRLKTGSAVAGQETTLTATYYAPPGVTSYQWFRNGTAIAGATGAEYAFTPVAADAGANYSVQATVDGKSSARSQDVTLRFDAFSPGFAKVEFFYDIGSATDVPSLINSAKYQANTPDEVRFLTAASTPVDLADNYGARMSFMFIPTTNGSYRFFTRSDDASAVYLSTDGTLDVTTATLLAQELGCCGAFMDPGNPETSQPQIFLAGDTNLIFALVKEGGGGDFLQIATREELDTTAAAALRPISGPVIGVMANGTGIGLSIAQNPANTNIVEERTAIFEARGVATPTGTPVVYRWQRNGVDIPGATGSRLTITNVPLSENNTTYRAIIGTLGGIQQTSTVAQLTVVADTFPPQPRVAALSTGNPFEFDISVTWDEQVMDGDASNRANYQVGPPARVTSVSSKYWTNDQAMVIRVTTSTNEEVFVTVIGVRDTKGNMLGSATRSIFLTNLLTWTGIGGDTLNTTRATDAFSDGAVALGTKDFDLISGGDGYWVNYDEATFVYEQITGDFDRAVRVEFQDTTSQWARTGLQVREALDTGVDRAQVTAGYKMSQNFTVRVNPVATCNRTDPGNNSYEILHRPIEGRNYDGFPAIFNIQNGFGGAPNYPTAWMRVRRVGQTIEAYKSDDGITWVGPASTTYTNDPATVDEDESLNATVFVGMFYAPEFVNNGTADCFGRSAIAKFRDYGPFSSGGGVPTISITRPGVVTYTGRLQSSPTLSPPTWSDVNGATSPYTVPSGTTMRFFRSASP
jgi:hypothetical protein